MIRVLITETCFNKIIFASEIFAEFVPRIGKESSFQLLAFKMSFQTNLGQTTEVSCIVEYIIDILISGMVLHHLVCGYFTDILPCKIWSL